MPSCETGAFMKHFIGVAVIVALALVVRFLLFQRFALGFYRHASTFQVILRDHPDPANEGHMKSGQRERLIPIREMMWKTGPRPLDRNSLRRFRPSPHPQLLLQLSQKPCPRQRTTEDLFKGNRQRQRTRQISEKSVGRILPDPRWLVFR
jgi:hypothetical protein